MIIVRGEMGHHVGRNGQLFKTIKTKIICIKTNQTNGNKQKQFRFYILLILISFCLTM